MSPRGTCFTRGADCERGQWLLQRHQLVSTVCGERNIFQIFLGDGPLMKKLGYASGAVVIRVGAIIVGTMLPLVIIIILVGLVAVRVWEDLDDY